MRKCLVILVLAVSPLASFAKAKKPKINISNRFADTYAKPDEVVGCSDHLAEFAGTAAANRAQLRNFYVQRGLDVLDVREQIYLGNIERDRSFIYTVFDVANVGATAAAGAVGGPAAAKAFALTATAIEGLKSSVVSNFDGGTANSLVSKIQSSYAENHVILKQNMDLDYESYDLVKACGDLSDLWNSGQKMSTAGKVRERAVVAPGSSSPGFVAR